MQNKARIAFAAVFAALAFSFVLWRIDRQGPAPEAAPAFQRYDYNTEKPVKCPKCGEESPLADFAPSRKGPQWLACPKCGADVPAQYIQIQAARRKKPAETPHAPERD